VLLTGEALLSSARVWPRRKYGIHIGLDAAFGPDNTHLRSGRQRLGAAVTRSRVATTSLAA